MFCFSNPALHRQVVGYQHIGHYPTNVINQLLENHQFHELNTSYVERDSKSINNGSNIRNTSKKAIMRVEYNTVLIDEFEVPLEGISHAAGTFVDYLNVII